MSADPRAACEKSAWQARHDRSVERLTQTARRFVEAWLAGDLEPSVTVAAQLGVSHGAARSNIMRARQAGLLPPLPEGHRARPVNWRPEKWLACATCHVSWPCAVALEWQADRQATEPQEGRPSWADGVQWAAAEADAQAAGREPVYILDITDHLRACADDPQRGSAVPRERAV